jgi:hypothetical protein
MACGLPSRADGVIFDASMLRLALVILCCAVIQAKADDMFLAKWWRHVEKVKEMVVRVRDFKVEELPAVQKYAPNLKVDDAIADLKKIVARKALSKVETDGCFAEPQAGKDLFLCQPGADKPSAVLVIYVNGICTSEAEAKGSATALAMKLGCNVQAVFNPSGGLVADLEESALDKLWPALLSKAVVGKPVVQKNDAAQHLAWLLVHHPGKIAIVSHSQGCMITRNAVIVAAMRDPSLLERLAWVAVGSPLRDPEYFPKPAKFREFTHANDLVAQELGKLPLPERPPSDWLPGLLKHDFTRAYLPEIRVEDLWPIADPAPAVPAGK